MTGTKDLTDEKSVIGEQQLGGKEHGIPKAKL